MIQHIDFVPEIIEEAKLFKKAEVGSLESAITELNEWKRNNSNKEILNIETVVLPNIHFKDEEGSADTDLTTMNNFNRWHQFIRVWYK